MNLPYPRPDYKLSHARLIFILLVRNQNPRARLEGATYMNVGTLGECMSDSAVCTAAFFRSLGKDVATEKEFNMVVSLTLRWLPAKDAPGLVKALAADGCVSVKDGYIRPLIDIDSVTVPITYKLPDALRERAANPAPKAPAAQKDLFETLIDMAVANGMTLKDFNAECRKAVKSLGVVPAVAGLLVLRDMGVDVSAIYPEIDGYILSD